MGGSSADRVGGCSRGRARDPSLQRKAPGRKTVYVMYNIKTCAYICVCIHVCVCVGLRAINILSIQKPYIQFIFQYRIYDNSISIN